MIKLTLHDHLLNEFSRFSKLWVGFSGGLDSTVLLDLLTKSTLRSKVAAVHIHHGLSVNADAWETHCVKICQQSDIPFVIHTVKIPAQNIEEEARRARYQYFKFLVNENEALVLAHHQDDQAETLLLQLFRGAGVDGAAAMPEKKIFGAGYLYRPLLAFSRKELEAYAKEQNLNWIDDESNLNTAFARNFLRHQIIPQLRTKWPAVTGNLARSAQLFQEAKANLEDLAEADLIDLTVSAVSCKTLKTLKPERLKNVLRAWLKRNNVRFPTQQILRRVIEEVVCSRSDAQAVVKWDGITIKKFKNYLYILKEDEKERQEKEWECFPDPLKIGNFQSLCAYKSNPGIEIKPQDKIMIRYRQGGELLRFHGQTKHLKKLFQEWGVVPWERDKIPLLYINGKLAAVIGYAISDDFFKTDGDFIYEIK